MLSCQKVVFFFKFEILNFGHLFQMGLALRVSPAGTRLTVRRSLSVGKFCGKRQLVHNTLKIEGFVKFASLGEHKSLLDVKCCSEMC